MLFVLQPKEEPETVENDADNTDAPSAKKAKLDEAEVSRVVIAILSDIWACVMCVGGHMLLCHLITVTQQKIVRLHVIFHWSR